MKARPENIERLLNGYIDGELTVRQQTEVKRLLGNDPMVARRLRQLEKCKRLLTSLPPAQAPAEMTQDIISRLARRSLLGEEPTAVAEDAGVRDLFMRKLLGTRPYCREVAALYRPLAGIRFAGQTSTPVVRARP